jgi:hypothetical protein
MLRERRPRRAKKEVEDLGKLRYPVSLTRAGRSEISDATYDSYWSLKEIEAAHWSHGRFTHRLGVGLRRA